MQRRSTHAPAALVAGAVLLAGLLAGCGGKSAASGSSSGASGDTITFGAVLSLTGSAASYGQNARGGMDVAVDEINAAGGINGKKVVVDYEDNQLQPATAATAAQKLVGQGVKIIFTHGSSITAAITKVTSGKGVIVPNMAAQSDAVVADPQVYSFIPTNNMELGHLADMAYTTLKGRKLAVIHSDDDYGKSASAAVVDAFQKLGGTVVANESHPPGTTDMRTQLIKIQAATPDVTAVLSNTGEIGHIVQQARELKLGGELVGADSALSQNDMTTAGDAYNGFKGVAIRFDPDRNDLAKQFAAKFQAKVGAAPNNYAAISYEAVKAVAKAIGNNGGNVDVDKIGQYLLTMKNVDGTLGPMTFGSNRVIEFPYYEWVIANGKITPLSAS
jgi:branched-chain amino acid transport system substrate-binding protein